jgi:hypothetical protein
MLTLKLSIIQDYAMQARVATVIGDTVFLGVKFAETDGPLLPCKIRPSVPARSDARS